MTAPTREDRAAMLADSQRREAERKAKLDGTIATIVPTVAEVDPAVMREKVAEVSRKLAEAEAARKYDEIVTKMRGGAR